jgi:hypothetical protein
MSHSTDHQITSAAQSAAGEPSKVWPYGGVAMIVATHSETMTARNDYQCNTR